MTFYHPNYFKGMPTTLWINSIYRYKGRQYLNKLPFLKLYDVTVLSIEVAAFKT